jgi:hypothetical protein
MSSRAACRLEQLGFTEVYDYHAGKADWLAHGLETEASTQRSRAPGMPCAATWSRGAGRGGR